MSHLSGIVVLRLIFLLLMVLRRDFVSVLRVTDVTDI